MTDRPVWRRCAVACAGIGMAAWIMRGQIGGALVARGDEFLYRSDPRGALRYYRRALLVNPGDPLAIDRYLFDATSLRDRPAIDEGIALAGEYLAKNPSDGVVTLDRAMALLRTDRPSAAMSDFASGGARMRDARALTFAGLLARKLGRFDLARGLGSQALAIDPRFAPARRLVTSSGPAR